MDNIISALKKLKPKCTKGPDQIPAFIIRDCASAFAKPLLILYNLILTSATFPTVWKKSRVCPVLKKGDRNNVENYRQITIICNFAKVFEIALHDILYAHLQGQITIYQHGFMKNRSTVSNLFSITQYIADHVDLNMQVDVIYTDFSKAFDRLDHQKLLDKLIIAGLSPSLAELFKSYLSGRLQFVECRGFKSFEMHATSGVPQGSVLGPLLFVLFINDIVDHLKVHYLLYADDMKIYRYICSDDDCMELQSCLNIVNEWCTVNGLPLNIAKCNVMSYSRKNNPITFSYKINETLLNRPKIVKDLGVTFDEPLTFNIHVNNIVQSSYKQMGFVIRNSSGFTDTNVLLLLFNAFVKSKLEYASLIWNPKYMVVQNVQRKFLKFLSFKLDGSYPPIGILNDTLFKRFSVQSLEDRRRMQSVIFLHKILNGKVDSPEILGQLCFHIPRIESRNDLTFYNSKPRTNLLKFSPLHFMCNNYNHFQNSIDIFNCKISSIKNMYSV